MESVHHKNLKLLGHMTLKGVVGSDYSQSLTRRNAVPEIYLMHGIGNGLSLQYLV